MSALDELLSRSVEAANDGSCVLRFGRVEAVGDGTVTVALGGVPIPEIPCISSYNPSAGDWAWLLRQGSLLVAIGCSKGTVNDERKS